MKKTILTLFLSAIIVAAQAQFTLSPSAQTKAGSSSEQELVAYAHVKNTGTTKKTFVWKMTRKNFPTAWKAALCDINTCYDVVVSRAEFELNAGDSGNLDVHLQPHNMGGVSAVEVEVFVSGDSMNSKIGTYTFSAWALSTGKPATKNQLEIYPNPTSTNLNITLETNKPVTFQVFNVLGQLKATHVHNGGTSTLDLSDLSVGVYFLRYTNEEGKVISKQFKKVQ